MNVKYSELEAILFIICNICKYFPQYFGGYLNNEDRESDAANNGLDRLRKIRPRLQYLNQVAHDYASSLLNSLDKNKKSEDDQLKLMAHKVFALNFYYFYTFRFEKVFF